MMLDMQTGLCYPVSASAAESDICDAKRGAALSISKFMQHASFGMKGKTNGIRRITEKAFQGAGPKVLSE